MRILLFIIASIVCFTVTAQKIDIAKDRSSADRASILNVIRSKVKSEVRADVLFIVRELWVKNNFAFLKGNIRNADNTEIDWNKTVFREAWKDGMFDGNSIYALCKKVNGQWKYIIHAVGPTDVVYACWASMYKAPRELFDVNENCR